MVQKNNLNRLKVVLCEHGRTSKWSAQELDVNPATVSKWCTNKIQPDLHTLSKVAEMLGVDIKDLLNSTSKSAN